MDSVAKIIISVFTLVIAITINLNNSNKRVIKKANKLFKQLEKYDMLSNIHDTMVTKISLFTSSYELASGYAYFYIVIYIFTVILSTFLISFSKYVWYIKTINVGLMMILPYTIINTFINVKYSNVKKSIPIAIEEFQYWFFRTKKISDSLRETSQHLKGNIAKPFQMCYYNISKGEKFAIQLLKDTFNDEHMDTFCQLLLVYTENGGDPRVLNASLTELVTQINLDISFKQKQKDRFMKYKIGAIILIAFTLIINKYLGLLFDDAIIQTNNMTVISLIIFFTIYFFFIDILERF